MAIVFLQAMLFWLQIGDGKPQSLALFLVVCYQIYDLLFFSKDLSYSFILHWLQFVL